MPFKKGQSGNPAGKPKGTLNKETLTKLERRAYFEKRAQEKFDEWIDKVRPEYGLDQFLGKAEEILTLKTKETPTERIKAIAELLKNANRPENDNWARISTSG